MEEPPRAATPPGRLAGWLLPSRIGAVYCWIAIVVVFGIIEPHLFLTHRTITAVLDQYAITAIVAMAVAVPMAAGAFDLSGAYTMGLAGAFAARLLTDTSLPAGVVVLVTLVVVGLGVGLLNSFIVVVVGIEPIIGTLGSGFLLGAVATGVDRNQTIVIPPDFATHFAQNSVGGIELPVFYLLGIVLILGFIMEQTATGRRWYALGFDFETARLAGIRVRVLRALALTAGSLCATVAGLALMARVGAHTPGDGPSYLLPAFAAVFLGATQLRPGRFNVWGTLIAVLMLGTGEYGLLLAGAPTWTTSVWQGVALITAVGVASASSRRSGRLAGVLAVLRVPWLRRRATSDAPPGPEERA
jgi:ribose transport system permease protein